MQVSDMAMAKWKYQPIACLVFSCLFALQLTAYQSPLGPYEWRLNDRGLIERIRFSSGSDTCNARDFEFVYADDKALVENRHPGLDPGSRNEAQVERGIYDENRHLIGKKSTNGIDYIRLDNFVVTQDHIYEKFSIEGVDLGILLDGQFQPCLFDQVGTLLAVGDFVSISSAFGVRNETLPIFEYFDYAGHGRDPETGLIAMGERLYDPQTQRFTIPDRYFLEHPEECIRSPQECDLHSYAKNNPLIYVDVDGQMAALIRPALKVLSAALTVKSGIDFVKEPSLRNAAELGIDVVPGARLGRAVKAADSGFGIAQVASSAKQGAQLKEHLRQLDRYGTAGMKALENGKMRYYDKLKLSNKPGEMAGTRVVREWDPLSDLKRTWLETVDRTGRVRQVRPQVDAPKTHYTFDGKGNYVEKW